MSSSNRLSGLQREVLQLYRQILREAVMKDRKLVSSTNYLLSQRSITELLSTKSSTSYARNEFRKQSSSVRRSDFKTIEFKIRDGRKKLQLLRMPGVNLVGGAG